MALYVPTIGLEIHAELKTRTKMFCGCKNDSGERHPNVNVCPVCLGHPGTLPVANEAAIKAVLKLGMALHGDIPAISKFDRKNYFYPDLPKGYQISQYDLPLVFGGVLKGVKMRRIHLEEDAGRLLHGDIVTHISKPVPSFVDFNRAGVPLMELVTEPCIRNADEVVAFAKELQLILRYLDVSDADMERGQLRVEANISVSGNQDKNDDKPQLGTKVEVKNLNSFRAVRDAIMYETERQERMLAEGKKVVHETRGWDERKHVTVSQRTKEDAHDYRYFPEPDLPPLDISRFKLDEIKRSIPELPQEKRVRFAREFNLKQEQIELLVGDRELAAFFEESVSELAAEDDKNLARETELIINYLASDLRGLMTEQGIDFDKLKVTPENFADLIEFISHGYISSRAAKNILIKMAETGGDPNVIVREEGLKQVSDETTLSAVVAQVLKANPAAAVDFRHGKENALQFLVGKAMAELRGKGNPTMLQKLFRSALQE